jgi:hypothetical protein
VAQNSDRRPSRLDAAVRPPVLALRFLSRWLIMPGDERRSDFRAGLKSVFIGSILGWMSLDSDFLLRAGMRSKLGFYDAHG